VACRPRLSQLVKEKVFTLHRVLKLFLVKRIWMALYTVGATFIHKLLGQVDVCLVEMNHIIAWFQILILRFVIFRNSLAGLKLVFLLLTFAVTRSVRATFLKKLSLKLIVARNSRKTGLSHCILSARRLRG